MAYKFIFWGAVFSTALLGANACGPKTNAAAETQDPVPKIVTAKSSIFTPSEDHAAILEIVEMGEAARAAGDFEGLTKAAHYLNGIGAHPWSDGTTNLQKSWAASARNLNANAELSTYRGRVKGPAYRQNILAPGASETLHEIYYAAEAAELTLKGSGLALVVAEQAGPKGKAAEAVCAAQEIAAPVSCQWLPLWTAKYDIIITNHGENPAPYLLVTN